MRSHTSLISFCKASCREERWNKDGDLYIMWRDEGCLPQRSPRSHWWATGSLVSWWQTSTEHRLGWTAPKENNKSFIEFELRSVHFNGRLSHTNVVSVSRAKSRTGTVLMGSTVRKCEQFLFVGATEPKSHTGVSWLLWEHTIQSVHYI